MRAVDIIQKKRDNIELEQEEIEFLLRNYLNGEVADYQMSAFMMAVYFNGMTDNELTIFTKEMTNSGDIISFDNTDRFLIDKHSTGGVGDKTTITLGAVFASLGMGTAKLSGRGLGHTGGTIDKFESIKGFRFAESKDEMENLIKDTGIGIMGYSDSIDPLDKKLYSLRDVTATVPSIPLIASSIMSKKLAVESDAIILDVKVGSGAFMKNIDEALSLAEVMVKIGKECNRKIVAVITDMDQPLGNAVGNSLELIEAIETLKGNGPKDFTDLIYELGAHALLMRGDVGSLESAIEKVKSTIESGEPLKALKDFIKKCNGDEAVVDDYKRLPLAKNIYEYRVKESGYIKKLEAELIGKAAMVLGAGRAKKDDQIDWERTCFEKKVGDKIEKEDLLLKIYYNDEKSLEESKKIIDKAVEIIEEEVRKGDIVLYIKR